LLNKKKAGHSHDLGMMGILLHVCGDAVNNIGVIIAALVIWKTDSPNRFYADPAVSMAISLMIFISSLPLGGFIRSKDRKL
jgi:solute carrier family 30 (zinc transporter), member 1